MNILLDTQSFLWFLLGDSRFDANTKKLFLDPQNTLYLSTISNWEIAQKYQLGKLNLPQDPKHYIPQMRELHDIETLPFDEISVRHLDKLPLLHKDPFDRMLICQALEHGLTILTNDRYIQQYPIKTLW